jgi:hypothetical protein
MDMLCPVTKAETPESQHQKPLRQRDWLVLPLLALLTAAAIMTATELIARRVFPEPVSNLASCLVETDAGRGVRGRPNSVCSETGFESGPVEYRFNGCGHRAGMECGPKAAGIYRIVLVGSSTAFGAHVQRQQSLAALLAGNLERVTGRRIEVYNEAMTWETPHGVALRMDEVLAAKPDLILWILTPWDIRNAAAVLSDPEQAQAGGFSARLRRAIKDSRSKALLQHFLYASNGSYARLATLWPGDPGFLAAKPDAEGQQQLADFDRYAAQVEGKAQQAGIPLAAVLIPERAQAAMLTAGAWPAGIDPMRLDRDLGGIVRGHEGIYLEILPQFRGLANPAQYYFPVDGHPNPVGHEMLAKMLARAMSDAALSGLNR